MPVCITGMHRSGTSMVARLLNLCGLYLGPQEKMMPARSDNPQGFWENMEFAALNESVLLQLGGRWHDPPLFTKDGGSLDAVWSDFTAAAAGLVQQFEGHEPWGWKDPRTSLTLPFWHRLFPELKLVICLRNPLDVARSLHKRNNFSASRGIDLWRIYNQRLMTAARPGQFIITHYDAYFSEPERELRRVLKWLGWQVSPEALDQACQTIASSLRNNRSTTADLFKTGVAAEVLPIYRQLCREASYVCPQSAPAETDRRPEIETPADAGRTCETAREMFDAGNSEAAASTLEKLLGVYPQHVAAHNDMGVFCYRKGDRNRALEHFKAALRQDPQDITARRNMADLYLEMGQTVEAVQALEEILNANPTDVETLVKVGKLCRQAGRYVDAAYFYDKVLKLRAGNTVHSNP